MKKKRFEISADRWPWQGYGWGRSSPKLGAPLNSRGARFGGGWDYNLGIQVAIGDLGVTVLLNLLFGMVRIRYNNKGSRT